MPKTEQVACNEKVFANVAVFEIRQAGTKAD